MSRIINITANLTDVIYTTGYEHRLVLYDHFLGDDIVWNESFDHGVIPISAGGRLISPEEFDPKLCQALGLDEFGRTTQSEDEDEDEDEDESPWGTHDVSFPPETIMVPEDQWFEPRGSTKMFSNPKQWRDQQMAWRDHNFRQVQTILSEVGNDFSIRGLYCRVSPDVWNPLSIGRWLKKAAYCACFSPYPYTMELIQTPERRILLLGYDAESG